MKRHRFLTLCTVFLCISMTASAQENNVLTLSGGYSFANIEDYDTSGTGWRINALYEFNRKGDPLAQGVAIGFISVSASGPEGVTSQKAEYTISSLPVYYSPKYMFGGESIKGFLRAALGIQFSWLSRTGGVATLEANDIGFYGGAGAGLMLMLGETMFVNAEYEWAYLSNSYYRDGFMNSVMGGVGFRF